MGDYLGLTVQIYRVQKALKHATQPATLSDHDAALVLTSLVAVVLQKAFALDDTEIDVELDEYSGTDGS